LKNRYKKQIYNYIQINYIKQLQFTTIVIILASKLCFLKVRFSEVYLQWHGEININLNID